VILGLADKVMTELSDSYWLSSTQIIEIGPGNVRQVLHRDMTNYPVFVPLGPAAPHVIMNFLIALTEFREDNGGTRVIPGSNCWPDFLDLDDERDQARTVPVEMAPGDCVLLGGKVVHGGGANTTADEHRRAIALSFSPGFLVPEQAFPFEVPLDLARTLPRKVQQMIGFRSFHNSSNLGGSLWQHNYEELADHLGLG
jgi:ectoine hydroxylase-related dioxygenase (phytanoyl-CoA dioxygenase family)